MEIFPDLYYVIKMITMKDKMTRLEFLKLIAKNPLLLFTKIKKK